MSSIYEVCETSRIIIRYDTEHAEKQVGLKKAIGREYMKLNGVEYMLLAYSFPPYEETWGIRYLEERRVMAVTYDE